MAAFKVNFPAIKPNKNLPPEIKALVPIPQPNSALSPEARRYQVTYSCMSRWLSLVCFFVVRDLCFTTPSTVLPELGRT